MAIIPTAGLIADAREEAERANKRWLELVEDVRTRHLEGGAAEYSYYAELENGQRVVSVSKNSDSITLRDGRIDGMCGDANSFSGEAIATLYALAGYVRPA